MNEIIVKRIKEARQERQLTQRDLAEHLGRSTAAISELERGKVQVSASDLFQIAQLLNKPIEYFFGEEYGDAEIQDLIAVLRKQPEQERNQSIKITQLLLQMQQVGDRIKVNPDHELTTEEIQAFASAFFAYDSFMKDLNKQWDFYREAFIQELKARNIKLG